MADNYYISLSRQEILEALKHLEHVEAHLARTGYVWYKESVMRKSSGLLNIYKDLGALIEDGK